MIDFGLSEDQEALQRAAREFLAAECPPALVRANAADGDGIPRGLYKKMAELGWMGLVVPEAMGGLGLSTMDLALVLEELGRAITPGPFLPTQLVIAALLEAGTEAQRATWFPPFLAADAFGTLAFAEGDQALEPAGITATAKRTRDGFVLSGTKLFVQDAPGADVFLVAARTKAGTTEAGVSLFLVDRRTKGVRVKPQEGFDLSRRTGEVVLKNALVPKTALVGSEGQGWPVLARLLDLACIGVAADSLGGAWKAHRDGGRVREDARAVRAQNRLLPGDEAHRRRDGRGRRAVALARLVRGLRVRPAAGGRSGRAPQPWPKPRSATSTAARRGAPSRSTAASASRGSSTCTSGSSAPT